MAVSSEIKAVVLLVIVIVVWVLLNETSVAKLWGPLSNQADLEKECIIWANNNCDMTQAGKTMREVAIGSDPTHKISVNDYLDICCKKTSNPAVKSSIDSYCNEQGLSC